MNAIDLKGRNAVITGGAKGIGFATAERLLASGAGVALWDMDKDRLAQAAARLEGAGKVAAVAVDITDEAGVDRATQETLDRLGSIDILVNNAGIAGAAKKLWEYSLAEWRQVVEIDLNGVFNCCRAIVPHMMQRGSGRIVNIASIAGKEGNPNAGAYSAAKAGVIGLTKSLGKELAQAGITVNCITPAAIETEIFQQITQEHIDYMRTRIPMGRFGKVEEAAAMVAWIASDDCSFTTGGVFDLSGGRAVY